MASDAILDPLVQHGFLGLSAVLLGLLIWLVRKVLELLERTNTIIHENTQAIRSLDLRNSELLRVTGDLRDRLLSRPCIIDQN